MNQDIPLWLRGQKSTLEEIQTWHGKTARTRRWTGLLWRAGHDRLVILMALVLEAQTTTAAAKGCREVVSILPSTPCRL